MANEIVDKDLLQDLQEHVDKIVNHFFDSEVHHAFYELGRFHEKVDSYHIVEDETQPA